MSISYAVFCLKKRNDRLLALSEPGPALGGDLDDGTPAVVLVALAHDQAVGLVFVQQPRPPTPALFPYTTLFRSPFDHQARCSEEERHRPDPRPVRKGRPANRARIWPM